MYTTGTVYMYMLNVYVTTCIDREVVIFFKIKLIFFKKCMMRFLSMYIH